MQCVLTLLGTGTCQLDPQRAASSVLIECGGTRVLYDMGRMVSQRLAAHGLRQDDIEHLILSHFHPDHLSDLIPYLHAGAWSRCDARSKNLNVYGPLGVRQQVLRLLSLFGPDELERAHWKVEVHEVRGSTIEVGSLRAEFTHLPPANNHGLRFRVADKVIALSGDSHFHEQEVQFLSGAELAVIDAGHLSEDELVELAQRAQPRTMVCSHIYEPIEVSRIAARAQQGGFRGEILEARDGMQFTIP